MRDTAKKLIFFVIVICVVFGMSQSAMAAGAFRTTAGVHVRATPSTEGKSLTIVSKETTVTVTEHDPAGWSKVQAGSVSGYIRSDFLKFHIEGTSEDFRTTAGVHLRSTSSTDAASLMVVSKNTTVALSQHDPAGWSKVSVSGKDGYIRSDFLKYTSTASSSSEATESTNSENTEQATQTQQLVASAQESPPSTATTMKTIGSVNLRAGSSTSTDIIRLLPKDTSVEVTANESNGWSKVIHNDTAGYIKSDLLKAASGDTTQPDEPVIATVTTAAEVNLREGPSTDTTKLKTLAVGVTVEIFAHESNGWSRVRADGKKGYIRTDLLPLGPSVELLNWSVVKPLLPTGKNIKLEDVRTGITYNIRIFSKGKHADWEPPTKEDTDAMLKSLGGDWSTTVRPVWITVGNRIFAGAIYPYPHDVSNISSNGVNGHFCLHFIGTDTHGAGTQSYVKSLHAAAQEAYDKRPR